MFVYNQAGDGVELAYRWRWRCRMDATKIKHYTSVGDFHCDVVVVVRFEHAMSFPGGNALARRRPFITTSCTVVDPMSISPVSSTQPWVYHHASLMHPIESPVPQFIPDPIPSRTSEHVLTYWFLAHDTSITSPPPSFPVRGPKLRLCSAACASYSSTMCLMARYCGLVGPKVERALRREECSCGRLVVRVRRVRFGDEEGRVCGSARYDMRANMFLLPWISCVLLVLFLCWVSPLLDVLMG